MLYTIMGYLGEKSVYIDTPENEAIEKYREQNNGEEPIDVYTLEIFRQFKVHDIEPSPFDALFGRSKPPIKEQFRERSPLWPQLQKNFLFRKSCVVCGRTKDLEAHHKKPYHLFPELELNWDNLIALCMGPLGCHYNFGHCGINWSTYNPNIVQDAMLLNTLIQNMKKNAKT